MTWREFATEAAGIAAALALAAAVGVAIAWSQIA